jgi:hypothetical protein
VTRSSRRPGAARLLRAVRLARRVGPEAARPARRAGAARRYAERAARDDEIPITTRFGSCTVSLGTGLSPPLRPRIYRSAATMSCLLLSATYFRLPLDRARNGHGRLVVILCLLGPRNLSGHGIDLAYSRRRHPFTSAGK